MAEEKKPSRTGAAEHIKNVFKLDHQAYDVADRMFSIQGAKKALPSTPKMDSPNGQSISDTQTERPSAVDVQIERPNRTSEQPKRTTRSNTQTGQSIRTPKPDTLKIFPSKTALKNPIRTEAQKALWSYLCTQGDHITTNDAIAGNLGLPLGTVRRVLRFLEEAGYITKEPWREGWNQGIYIAVHGEKTEQANWTPKANTQNGQSTWTVQMDSPSSPSLDRKIEEEQSIYKRLKNLKQDDIDFHYPALAAIGFGPTQIEQILGRLETVGKNPDRLFEAMEYADWEIDNGGIKDKEGKQVNNPLGFVFQSLARGGYYRKPKGFVSQDELAARDARERAEDELKAQEAADTAAFEVWRRGLSPEDLARLKSEAEKASKFLGPEEVWLKTAWKNKEKGGQK